MCIICRLTVSGREIEGATTASALLDAFEEARAAMKKATAAMLACSKLDREYDPAHKVMVGLCRDWNRLEEQREAWCDAKAH